MGKLKIFLVKIWAYGVSTPFQRIGLIVLSIGILSYLTWVFTGNHYGYGYTYPGVWIDVIFDPDYFPEKRNFIFFHLYLYLIPLGLLMTWGYKLLLKIKNWITDGNKNKSVNMEILYFKNNEAAWEVAEKYFPTEPDDKLIAENQYLSRLLEDYEGLDHDRDEIAISTTNEKSFCVAIFPKNHPTKYPKGTLIFYTPINLLNEYEGIPGIWMGVINATVAPEFHPKKGWKIIEKFTET